MTAACWRSCKTTGSQLGPHAKCAVSLLKLPGAIFYWTSCASTSVSSVNDYIADLRAASGCSGWLLWGSVCWEVFGDFDHEYHGVFGLVAEGVSYDVHSVLVSDSLQGDSIHRHQLKSSLWPSENITEVLTY